jgi:hypothetical protein
VLRQPEAEKAGRKPCQTQDGSPCRVKVHGGHGTTFLDPFEALLKPVQPFFERAL